LESAGDHLFAAMNRAGMGRVALLTADLPAAITLLEKLTDDTRSQGNLIVEAVATCIVGLALHRPADVGALPDAGESAGRPITSRYRSSPRTAPTAAARGCVSSTVFSGVFG